MKLNFIPYFAESVHCIVSIAFSYAITDGWNLKIKGEY